MSLSSVISMAREYLLPGGILAVVIIVLFLAFRHFHTKRTGKERRRINVGRLIWWLVFLCYIFVVIGATMLSRFSGFYEGTTIPPLFYSYRNAWNNWSGREWRNIIWNICMFAPFGLLLPVGIKWFRKFYRTYIAGFLFSLFIELSQKVFKVGIFEFDDLWDNTLGTLIGFGIFVILYNIFAKETEKYKWGATLATNIPLILAVASFASILIVYSCKELGNNNNRYAMVYDPSLLNIHGEEYHDETAKTLPVFKSEKLSEQEAYKRAEALFKKLDGAADITYAGYYDDEAWIRSRASDGHKQIIIRYEGGSFEYSDMGDYGTKGYSFSEEEVRKVLEGYGYNICKDATFTVREDSRMTFEVDRCEENGVIQDGSLTVKLTRDKKIIVLDDSIRTVIPYKDYTAISEAEAFKRLKEGKFKRYGNDYLDIEVLSCKIAYSTDTKGFYQPNYRFDVNINGKEAWIMIPALEAKSEY